MAYNVYLAALLAPLVVFPVVRTIVLALSGSRVLAALVGPSSVPTVGMVLGLLMAALMWLGVLYGPVTLEPAFVRLLADTDLPRHRTLSRPFAIKAAAVVGVALMAAALFGGVLVNGGFASLAGAARFTALCAMFAVMAAVAWLAGQATSQRVAGLAGALTTALALLGLALPGFGRWLPWGWVAAAWPPIAGPPATTDLALGVVAALAVVATRPLLDRLRSSRLTDDATRWRAATTAALSGDVAHALGSLRARPSVGRRWSAVRGGPSIAVFLVRDMVGAARTPVRLLVGIVTLVAAVITLALASSLPAGWVLASVGATGAYLAVGVLADGFRHATDAAVAPALYGYGTPALFSRHGVAPLAGAAVAAALGAVSASALGIGMRLLPVCVVLILVVLARAYDSAKGPLPVVLLTPMPSPIGDLSSVNVSLWEADALIIAMVAGALAVAAAGSPVRLLVFALVVVALLVLGLRRRLRRL
ncbi:hypothetical protein [Cellulomonas sp. 73-145]|uniref:hypothetical protein n=1 Tax=Cellulomonas sp. 73-145 TaxID=1895739 RepID=UPI0025C10318|nr:hypothetical protein [Cellulomonas sp. 73-145]